LAGSWRNLDRDHVFLKIAIFGVTEASRKQLGGRIGGGAAIDPPGRRVILGRSRDVSNASDGSGVHVVPSGEASKHRHREVENGRNHE
jgi:hypothetical protein